MIPVILLDKGSDRERTIYRPMEKSGWVYVLKHRKVKPGVPLVITLKTADWVRTRR